MSTRSRRQLSVVCLQLAWLEEQRSTLVDTVAIIESAITSGRQWIQQDVEKIDFPTMCQAIEQTSAFVVQTCSDILNENCSPFMYQADTDPQTEKDSNQKQDIEPFPQHKISIEFESTNFSSPDHDIEKEKQSNQEKYIEPDTQHTISDWLESNIVPEKTEKCLSESDLELIFKSESECLPQRTEGNVSHLATQDNEVSRFEVSQFQTGDIDVDTENPEAKNIEAQFFEQICSGWITEKEYSAFELIHKFSEGDDVNANDPATVDSKQDNLVLDHTACYDRAIPDKPQIDDFIDSVSAPQQTESIAPDMVSKDTKDPQKESEQEENVVSMSEIFQDGFQSFESQDGKKQDAILEAGESQQPTEMTNSKHEIKTSGDNVATTSEEESIEEFYKFLIKMLVTSPETNPIECLIKGVDSVDGKFLDRVTERKSRDPVKDQLIRELMNRRLYHYTSRETIPETSSAEITPRGILRNAEANGEPPKMSFSGVGARKRVTFNENKSSDDMKTVFESFHKPKEENTLMTSKSEFDDKGKNVTLVGVKHFSEFFETRVQKESPKTNSANSTKHDPTIAKRPPAFTACIPYGVFHTVTTGATVKSFDDVICNTGNHFNPRTGEFTAPSSGVYVTSVTLRQVGAGYVGVDVIKKTNNTPGRSESRVSGAHTLVDNASASCLGVTEMMAGDMICLKGLQRGDAQLNMYSSFSCFKLT
ncbi:unnamed protein product [Lymnaea stagnalis]|uniref:C1q domain-containing protein n=1 Tax=Lymnaea stagnalis TaxID=6523 RepID=A0AAV2I996_LYMST